MKHGEITGFQTRLVDWYRRHHRRLPWRETADPYRIWVSEVMLQQTQVKTVTPYYNRFIDRFPLVGTLAAASLEEVLKLWEGLGYYARARNLHRAACLVASRYGCRVPDTWDSIHRLPGVGDYIAAAVLSIAFNQAHAVVDGNVKRVLARIHANASPVNRASSHKEFVKFAKVLLDIQRPGVFNQAMMELGALVCKPAGPLCDACPVKAFCLARAKDEVASFPKRVKPKPTPRYHIAAGVVQKDGTLLITRRPTDGLLGGLWEFPGGKVGQNEDAAQACIREINEETGLTVDVDRFLTRVKHAYTHFKIVLDVFCCRYKSGRINLNGPVDYRWIRPEEMDRFAFPKANHKFMPLLKERLAQSEGGIDHG